MEATERRTRTLLLSPSRDGYDHRERPAPLPVVAHAATSGLFLLRALAGEKEQPDRGSRRPASCRMIREGVGLSAISQPDQSP